MQKEKAKSVKTTSVATSINRRVKSQKKIIQVL